MSSESLIFVGTLFFLKNEDLRNQNNKEMNEMRFLPEGLRLRIETVFYDRFKGLNHPKKHFYRDESEYFSHLA